MIDGHTPAVPGRDDVLEGLRRIGRDLRHARVRSGRVRRRARHGRRSAASLRRRWPRRTLIVSNIATAVVIAAAAGMYGYVEWRLGQIQRIHVLGLKAAGHSSQSALDGSSNPPFTVLVIGSDSRSIANGSSFGQLSGAEAVEGQRSDSIILVRVVPRTRSIAILSIPRDTVVKVPGYGPTRINTAFNTGSPSLLVQVLDQDFGIEVNHVAVFNFDTFEQVADAVGGVEQYFPAPAQDIESGLVIPSAGCYDLKGAQALAFVRSRNYQYYLDGQWNYQLYPESDLARIQRQQAFFKAVARKVRKLAPTDPIELDEVVAAVTKNLTLDSGFSDSLLLAMVRDYRTADLSTIPSYVYPVNNVPGTGALSPDVAAGRQVIRQWLAAGREPARAPAPPAGTSAAASATTSPPTTTVAPASVSISVENGSGVEGQAASASSELASLGYRSTVSGDATVQTLATSELYYAPDSLEAATQLRTQTVGGATLAEDPALSQGPFNLLLVTGRLFGGIRGAGHGRQGAVTTTSSTTTTTMTSPAYAGTATINPASSSLYRGAYIPPGLEPGQVPETCGA